MGRIGKEDKKEDKGKGKGKEAKEEKKEEPEAEPEDPPLVKKLKAIDDKYLGLEKEYERECQKLLMQFAEKQQPFLDERKALLTTTEEETPANTGTPALSGFWLKALHNHPALEYVLQEWDRPVLEFLRDIEKEQIEETEDGVRGFRLKFHFVENPYFENSELVKEYKMAVANPYCGEIEVKGITGTTINWKAGKDVTVEKVAGKKAKGGGAKKAKQKKEKEEPRPSFFRDFFRNLHPEMKLPADAKEQALTLAEEEGEEDSDDEENLLAYLMEADHDIGTALRDNIIPFAVRWYTGEAAPEIIDDDEDEEEEEEDDDDDEEDDSEDEPVMAKGRGKGSRGGGKGGAPAAAAPKGKPKGKAKASPEMKPADGAKQEECKQQ